jgi:hypothetical protein
MQPSWTDIGVFWITIGVGIVTAAATAINYFLYKVQVAPEIVVLVVVDDRRPSMINLVIENIGKGVAKNIRFTSSEPIPKAYGVAPSVAEPATLLSAGPFVSGIPALGPGAKRVLTWGQYGGLHSALGNRVIKVTATYTADQRTPWDPEEYSTESLLDVRSLEGLSIPDHNYDKAAADDLKKIADAVQQLSTGWRVLKVEVQEAKGDAD